RAKNGFKPRCKSCTKEYMSKWLDKNPGYVNDQMKKAYRNNTERFKARSKQYCLNNKEKKSEYNKKYREENKEKINRSQSEYIKNKIISDPEFRMLRTFRKLIHRLKTEKRGRSESLLGYSAGDLFNHLGRYLNKGECIDHKIPCSWFI